jgi:hypothetical protein
MRFDSHRGTKPLVAIVGKYNGLFIAVADIGKHQPASFATGRACDSLNQRARRSASLIDHAFTILPLTLQRHF